MPTFFVRLVMFATCVGVGGGRERLSILPQPQLKFVADYRRWALARLGDLMFLPCCLTTANTGFSVQLLYELKKRSHHSNNASVWA